MEYRTWDNQGVSTSLLGFGCMRLPTDAEGHIHGPLAERLLDRAMAAGVNYFDTAYRYLDGEGEPFVGKVLQKYERNSFYLATKLPIWEVETVADAKRIFADQLSRLRTDYVDFYLIHAVNVEKYRALKAAGVIDYCARLKEEGKIRRYGFSFHDSYQAFEEILTDRSWDFCQIQYNYMDTREQAGDRGYALAERLGVPLVVMEPVKGGSLANFSPDVNDAFHALRPEASVASFALRWVASHPNVKVVLSGMSSEAQVEDNLKTFSPFVPMDEEEMSAVGRIVARIRNRGQNGCTGCRYCMPCPAGVDIPENFSIWNRYHMYGTYEHVKWDWEKGLDDGKKARNCVACGRCETLCPQKLPIRRDLAQAQRELDGAAQQ